MFFSHHWDPRESCDLWRAVVFAVVCHCWLFATHSSPKKFKLVLVYLVIYLLYKPAIHLISRFEEMSSLQYKSQAVMTGTKHTLDQLIYVPGNSVK